MDGNGVTLPLDIKSKFRIAYDTEHGGPYDRGSADSYYGRNFDPHWYPAGTGKGNRVEMANMSAHDITAYTKGFNDNEEDGNHKDWG